MALDMRIGDAPECPRMTVLTAQSDNATESVGLLHLLGERYETPQARGKAFERIMQQAFRLHLWVPKTRPWALTCRDAGRC